MANVVLLEFIDGDFQRGFTVNLQIRKNGDFFPSQYRISSSPNIPQLYDSFKNGYEQLGVSRTIQLPPAQVTNISLIGNCKQAALQLEQDVIDWLSQDKWQEIRVRIEDKFKENEAFIVIFQFKLSNVSDIICLKKIPWHFWNLFEYREDAYFSLSAQDAPKNLPLGYSSKILAIFGGSDQGLQLVADRQLLTNLESKGAIVTPLNKPSRQDLNDKLWKYKWDILFFAGHSWSNAGLQGGEFIINDNEHLSPQDLKQKLKKAVRKGLKLAIFNSCDGLGLATILDSAKVPQMIVMREPIPDEVARKFLEYFLEAFVDGKYLYLAVREACERLEDMEYNYPCASWLPIICQNPNAEPLQWHKRSLFYSFFHKLKWRWNSLNSRIKKILASTLLVILIAVGVIAAYNYLRIYPPSPNPKHTNVTTTATAKPTPPLPKPETESIKSSEGEKFLIASSNIDNNNNGTKYFASQDYNNAIKFFSQSLQNAPNNPEARIYLNNAVANNLKEIQKLRTKEGEVCATINSIDNKLPLRIAAVVPANSYDKDIALEMLRGVSQAQNEINCKGGISGRMLQVVIFDDEDKPQVAENVAEEIVKEDFLAVVGHAASSTTWQAGTIYENKVIAVSPVSTAIRKLDNNDGLSLSDYIFRTAVNDNYAIKKLLTKLIDGKNSNIAIAYTEEETYSKRFFSKFKNELQTLKFNYINDNNKCVFRPAFKADECVDTIKENAKALLLIPGSNSLDDALKLLEALKKTESGKKLTLLGGDTMYHSKTLGKIEGYDGKNAEGLVVAVHWLRNQDNNSQSEIEREFRRKAKEVWGTSDINWRTVTSYDATQAIIAGLQKSNLDASNSVNDIRKQLQKKLSSKDKSFSASGALGKVEFENGDRKVNANSNFGVLGQVKNVGKDTQGQDKYDFVPIP
ncbi:extracellular ligand-binding receptor [Calothrix sp. NIES-4071]|nr:extracellular ligand-binding receptor [Calothrix sp. NIES-4071]BAZ59878.1 extracellular ligand-binding receptor [Calothrix sp. NIES-4105]